MLISVCYLVLKGLIQTTSAGTTRIMDFVDEQHMCHLYEKFILEYYRTEFPAIKAEASQIKWMLDDDNGSMLPIMKSDITLSYGDKVLIIDAKYYAHTTQVQFDKHTIHSGNLYQIFTYVKNKEAELKELSHEVAGMLLYAKTDEEIQPDNEYWMSGNKIGVKTLDLSGDFDSIEKQLYAIAKDFFGDVVDTHFYLNARGCTGVGVRNGNLGFMLLAGSQISQKEPSSTCPEHIHRLREEYSDKMQNGVWRCCTRVEHGPNACDAPTISESELQMATVKAINKVLKCSDSMQDILKGNIEKVLSEDQTDGKLEALNKVLEVKQHELAQLAKNDDDYSALTGEVDDLREKKQELLVEKARMEGYKSRIKELGELLKKECTELTEYDEEMVRNYIKGIKVYDDRFTVSFKAGIDIDIQR